MKQDNIKKLFGSILIHDKQISRDLFSKIDPEWMLLKIHKDVYKSMNELYKSNVDIDMLTTIQKLKELKLFKNSYIHEISKMSSDLGYLNPDSILNACMYDFKVRQMQLLSRDFTNEANSDQMSVDALIEISEKIKKQLIDGEKHNNQTNDEIINDVLVRHEMARNGEQFGLELGWLCTRNKIILEEIDVMVVGGRPAMGKTAWMISAIKKLAFDQGKKVSVMSLEMSSQQIMRRLLSHITDIDSNSIKLGECNESEISILNSCRDLKEWENLTIFDGSMSVMDITKNITEAKNKGGCDVYMVDYLQKIIPSKSENRYQEVTKISNDIKRLTMSLKTPCIALAQLSRDSARSGKRPTLPDLKESGEIEQDASVVTFLHRPEYYGEVNDENGDSNEGKGEFLIAKNREGVTGIVEMNVDLKTSGWNDPTPTFSSDAGYKQTSLNEFAPDDDNPF